VTFHYAERLNEEIAELKKNMAALKKTLGKLSKRRAPGVEIEEQRIVTEQLESDDGRKTILEKWLSWWKESKYPEGKRIPCDQRF
jgi:hypothetical protein